MKAVMISIRPKWCRLIASGKKTVEVRKSAPKLETPFKCYIYQTNSGKVGTGLFLGDGTEIMGRCVKNGTVIGEFVCDRIFPYCQGKPIGNAEEIQRQSCLTQKEIWNYAPSGNPVGWHISDLVIYDTPKELGEFRKPCRKSAACYPENCSQCVWDTLTRPPQSWCYVDGFFEKDGDGNG